MRSSTLFASLLRGVAIATTLLVVPPLRDTATASAPGHGEPDLSLSAPAGRSPLMPLPPGGEVRALLEVETALHPALRAIPFRQEEEPIDYTYVPWEAQRHFGVAAGEIFILEFIPWALAKWVRHWEDPADNWANISSASIWKNLEEGWEYDGDNFLTNVYAHPYHGALFFNAGRTNGYTFWESVPFSLMGSAIWEHFGETFRPAYNDWINTGLTGANLGEVFYRLSTMVTDNTATGSERVWGEIWGALLNPVRGFNRLITGETARRFPNPPERTPGSFAGIATAGVRGLDADGSDVLKDPVWQAMVDLDIHYGDPFTADLSTPFTWFRFGAGIAFPKREQDSLVSGIARIHSTGHLFAWRLGNSPDTKHQLGFALQYDYVNNPAFVFGNTAVTAGWLARYRLGEGLFLSPHAQLTAILMGATKNDYYLDVEGRNYDFGPGFGMSLGASLSNGGWTVAQITYGGGWIWTMSEPGDSRHHLHSFTIAGQYPFSHDWAAGVSVSQFWRESYYPEPLGDVNAKNPIARAFVSYRVW